MGALSGKQIAQLIRTNPSFIYPFDERFVQPASYDLRLGSKILASPLGKQKLGVTIDLTPQQPDFAIQPGQMVAVLSMETLGIPLDICGRFGIRSGFARLGINAFGGLQLDPGFKGRLTMNLLNVGPEPVTITFQEAFFSVEFQRLEEPAEAEYAGPYQHQEDFPRDQYEFILSARTTSLAEIPALRDEVARLNILIEEIAEMLPDPDEGFVLRPEIESRLLESLKTPDDHLISTDEIRKKLRL